MIDRVPNLALWHLYGADADAYPTLRDSFGDLDIEDAALVQVDVLREAGVNPVPARPHEKRPKFFISRAPFDAADFTRLDDPARPPDEGWHLETSPLMTVEAAAAMTIGTVRQGQWRGACAYVGRSRFTVFDFDFDIDVKREIRGGDPQTLAHYERVLWRAVGDFVERLACPVAFVASGMGVHVWAVHPQGMPKLAESNPAFGTCEPVVKVDVRSSTGLVMAPGSTYPDGRAVYTYLRDGKPASVEAFGERLVELLRRDHAFDPEGVESLRRREARPRRKGGGGKVKAGKYEDGGALIEDGHRVLVVSSDLRHRSAGETDLAGRELTMGEVAEMTHPERGDYREIRVRPLDPVPWGRRDTESGHGAKWWGPPGGDVRLLVYDYREHVFWTQQKPHLGRDLISLSQVGHPTTSSGDGAAGDDADIDLDLGRIGRLLGLDAWHEIDQSIAAQSDHAAEMLREMAAELGVDAQVVQIPEGYIGDHLRPMGSDELRIIVAPHGTGKTHYIEGEVRRAKAEDRPVVAVQPTQALTEANAARLGLTSQYASEDALEGARVACCVNSLPRATLPFAGLFVADEYEQSDAYCHSGKVEQPLAAYDAMREALMTCDRAIVSSASLPLEQLVLLLAQVRRHAPQRRVTIVVQPPKRGEVTVRACKLTEAYAGLSRALDRAAEDPHYRIAVLCTSKKMPRELVRLCERRGLRADYVSGENSRLDTTREKLRDPASMFDHNQVLYLNPAVGSGVDFPEADEVFMLDMNPNLPVELLGQLARRIRKIGCGVLVWGLKKWSNRKDVKFDDDHLDKLACARAQITDGYVHGRLPQWRNDYKTGQREYIDPEFAQSWRLHERIRRQSLAQPLGRRFHLWESYGWEVEDRVNATPSEDDEDTAKAHRVEMKTAKAEIKQERIEEVATARDIDAVEAEEIRTAHEHQHGDREALIKHRIAEFYDLDCVTPEDVEIDDDGKFRKSCRSFAAAKLHAEGEEGQAALAAADARANSKRHVVHKRSRCFEAELINEALTAVFKVDAQALPLQPIRMTADDVRDAVLDYLDAHGDGLVQETLGLAKRSRSGDDKYALRAWNAFVRRLGGKVRSLKSSGGPRHYVYDFALVDERSAPERCRIVERYKLDAERIDFSRRAARCLRQRRGGVA